MRKAKHVIGAAMITLSLVGFSTVSTTTQQVEASEYQYSYNLGPDATVDIYENMNGDSFGGKAIETIEAFIPAFGSLISNNGIDTESRKEIEKAYHSNSGLKVTVEAGAYGSWNTSTSFESL
ncbi:hypothetical protein [Bacillus sp. JCM 19041]|uniref:hypothetical protein n=1 Tax=Bacillus sp. JCM 19041 TaxID=1460637 RepID=UPI0006D22F38